MIDSYMTAMGNSEASDIGKTTISRQHGGAADSNLEINYDSFLNYQQQTPNSQRSGHGHGHGHSSSVPLGRPINIGPSSGPSSATRQLPSSSSTNQLRNQQPYSFMLDVYPVKDAPGQNGLPSTRTSAATIVLPPPPSFRQQPQQHQQQTSPYNNNNNNNNYNDYSDDLYSGRFQNPSPLPINRPTTFNQQQLAKQQHHSLLQPHPDDHLLSPIPYRPPASRQPPPPQFAAPPADDPNKPKLVVHLNVYKGQSSNNNNQRYIIPLPQ